jgi:tetratricopeptide (TPR) repeat protein
VLQLVVAAVVCLLMVGIWAWQARRTADMAARLDATEPLLDLGDVASLRRAADELQKALAVRPGNDVARSRLALVLDVLWVEHGFEDARAAGKVLTAAVVRDDVSTPERPVAEVLAATAERRFATVDAVAQSAAGASAAGRLAWAFGLADLARGQPRAARGWLRRAVEARPDAAHWQLALGDAIDLDGDPTAAATAWQTAAWANPADLQAVARDLVARLRQGGSLDSVARALAHLGSPPDTSAGPRDRAALLGARAMLEQMQGDPAAASATLDEALRLAPEDAWLPGLRRAIAAGTATPRP